MWLFSERSQILSCDCFRKWFRQESAEHRYTKNFLWSAKKRSRHGTCDAHPIPAGFVVSVEVLTQSADYLVQCESQSAQYFKLPSGDCRQEIALRRFP